MAPERIASIIRHLATFYGGLLLTKHAIPPEYIEAIIGGIAAIAAIAWGIVSKQPVFLPPPVPPNPPKDTTNL